MATHRVRPLLLVLLGAASLYALVGVSHTTFSASWDGEKSSSEQNSWMHEIETWNTLLERWNTKREQRHDELYPGMIDSIDNRSYCNDRGCWESDMFSFTFTAPDGTVTRVEKARTDADAQYPHGGSWRAANGGQSLVFTDSDTTSWESANFGQVLVYKDARSNRWESSNFGQVVTFEGSDGSSWESANFGQTLTHHGSGGSIWNDSNFGQSGSYSDESGDGWDLFDVREYIP